MLKTVDCKRQDIQYRKWVNVVELPIRFTLFLSSDHIE